MRNIVGVAKDVLVVAIVPLQGAVYMNYFAFVVCGTPIVADGYGVMHGGFVAVKVFYIGTDPALILEGILVRFNPSLVLQYHHNARIQKCEFTQTVDQSAIIEYQI